MISFSEYWIRIFMTNSVGDLSLLFVIGRASVSKMLTIRSLMWVFPWSKAAFWSMILLAVFTGDASDLTIRSPRP
jgi:hypothetical protein